MLKPLEFDCSEVAEKEITPILKELERVCIENHIPFNVCVCYAQKKIDEKDYKAEYIRMGRTPASFDFMVPKNDEIGQHYSISAANRTLIQTSIDYSYEDFALEDSTEF